jgi:hypothetical protein
MKYVCSIVAYRCVGGLVSAHWVRDVRQDAVMVRDRWRWWGSRHVRHPRPRPREVPLKVRYPGHAVVKAVLGDDVLLVRTDAHLSTYGCSLLTNDVTADTPLRVHLA